MDLTPHPTISGMPNIPYLIPNIIYENAPKTLERQALYCIILTSLKKCKN